VNVTEFGCQVIDGQRLFGAIRVFLTKPGRSYQAVYLPCTCGRAVVGMVRGGGKRATDKPRGKTDPTAELFPGRKFRVLSKSFAVAV